MTVDLSQNISKCTKRLAKVTNDIIVRVFEYQSSAIDKAYMVVYLTPGKHMKIKIELLASWITETEDANKANTL